MVGVAPEPCLLDSCKPKALHPLPQNNKSTWANEESPGTQRASLIRYPPQKVQNLRLEDEAENSSVLAASALLGKEAQPRPPLAHGGHPGGAGVLGVCICICKPMSSALLTVCRPCCCPCVAIICSKAKISLSTPNSNAWPKQIVWSTMW